VDWLTFISNLIGNLVWPAVTVLLLLLVRPYLGGLARRLEELTLPGGARAKFREELEAAREQAIPVLGFTASSLTAAHHDSASEAMGGDDQFLHLASRFPEAAILQSYQEVERILSDHAASIPDLQSRRPIDVIRHLQQRELIDGTTVELFNRLRTMRNEAAQTGDRLHLSLDEAIEYRALCRSLSEALHVAFKKFKEGGAG
jgi:hypothetical protein